jgi:geranylgeranyl diphosphate synthase type II
VRDVGARAEDLGKSPGKDAGAHKMTYPALYGLERSRVLAAQHAEAARSALERDFPRSDRLQALAVYFVQRMQ